MKVNCLIQTPGIQCTNQVHTHGVEYVSFISPLIILLFLSRKRIVIPLQAPIQKFADKLSAYFVPTVIVISILTWVIWLIYWICGHHVAKEKIRCECLP